MVIDLGNFLQTGQYSNFGPCDESISTVFDTGPLNFPMINMVREDYFKEPPFDFSGLAASPLGTLISILDMLGGGSLEGNFCQQAGLTSLGEFLITEMMQRGMIIEVDHLPRLSYKRAYELLMENDYPAAGTHGLNNNGILYELGRRIPSNVGKSRTARHRSSTLSWKSSFSASSTSATPQNQKR